MESLNIIKTMNRTRSYIQWLSGKLQDKTHILNF